MRKSIEAKEKKANYNTRYDAIYAAYYSLKLNHKTDPELIEFLNKQPNKQKIIKEALLDYMRKESKR